MSTPQIDLNRLRVATPCPPSWEQMQGNDSVRFCDLCQLNVYNIASMTASETQELIARNDGRICGRLYRRTDGTVLTKDCPVGLRALRKRVSKKVAAVFAAILSVCFNAAGQQSSEKEKSCETQTKITRKHAATSDKSQMISGVVSDPNGAAIPGVSIEIRNTDTGEARKTTTDDHGTFAFGSVTEGDYLLKIEATQFQRQEIRNLRIAKNELLKVDATLQPKGETVTVGLLLDYEPSLIDRPFGTTIISGDLLRRLPF